MGSYLHLRRIQRKTLRCVIGQLYILEKTNTNIPHCVIEQLSVLERTNTNSKLQCTSNYPGENKYISFSVFMFDPVQVAAVMDTWTAATCTG